ncbi:hypothetical protein B566_EDAN019120 [Ephemera danica]|nr:hypothetical protein B566_EDAN019120 [Ephemera danica]
MTRYGVLVTTLAALLCQTAAQGPTLDIPGLGTVMGDTALSYVNDRIYYRFRGMPFAQQPAPGPVQPWAGVFNATRVGNRCPQVTVDIGNKTNPMRTNRLSTTEDCLYLSVYTPNPTAGANMPVVVFFHGGAFEAGSGIIYDGQKFMDYDVILVVAHYRLGPFGFLCLDTDDIPGNAGMLDQVAALQWTRDYINVFGGDSNAITIMGESAGAASVSLHNISPLSTNMFKQFIPQSGGSTAIWAIDYNAVYAATEIGKLLNCSSLEIPELTTCFQNDNELREGRSPFQATSPVVQKAGAVRFLERKPRDILDSGEYTPHAALIGANKHEGTLVYSSVQDQGESVSAIMEKSHFGQANMGNYTAITPGLVDYFGNMFLKGPAYEQAQYNSKVAPTYLYGFHYFGDRSVWSFIGDPDVITGGVNHAQELLLQFDIPGLILSARDRAMSKTVMDLWINFIVNGNPTPATNPVEGVPTWPMFDGTTRFANYLVINENSTSYVASDWTLNEFFVSGNEGFPWLTDH